MAEIVGDMVSTGVLSTVVVTFIVEWKNVATVAIDIIIVVSTGLENVSKNALQTVTIGIGDISLYIRQCLSAILFF
jgi:hypothetical protein